MGIAEAIAQFLKLASIFAVPFFERVKAKQDAIKDDLKRIQDIVQSDSMVKLSDEINEANDALDKALEGSK